MSNVTNSISTDGQHDQVGQLGQVRNKPTSRLRLASEIAPNSTEWLWPDRIPLGNLTTLEGVPGHGKSAVAYDLASTVTLGVSFPYRDRKFAPAGVVILQGEDDHESTVVPSLVESGADRSRIVLIDELKIPSGISDLVQAVRKVQAKLVIIDPITSFFGFSVNNDQSVRRVLGPLRQLAQQHELAIVLVRHLRKSTSGLSEYHGAGSIGIIGACRSGLRVESHPNELQFHHQISNFKGNLASAPPQPYRTVKCQSGAIAVEWFPVRSEPVNGSRPLQKHQSKLDQAADFLFQILGNGPVRSTEIFKAARDNDITEKTLRRAKKREAIDDWKRSDGRTVATYWELPSHCDEFFVQIAQVLDYLLRRSRVEFTHHAPRVIIQKDQIVVVRSHLGGGTNLYINIEADESRDTGLITVEDEERTVEFNIEDFSMLDKFQQAMKGFNLVWDPEEYAQMTALRNQSQNALAAILCPASN